MVAGQTSSAIMSAAGVAAPAQAAQPMMSGGGDGGGAVEPAAPSGLEGVRCAKVTLTGAVLRVDYGTGCVVQGRELSGAYEIYVRWKGSFMLGVNFEAFGINGVVQDGNMELGIGVGKVDVFADVDVTENGELKQVEIDGTVRLTRTDVNVDGSGRYADVTREASFVATGLHATFGGCYPDAGTLEVSATGYPNAVVTFDAMTPSTGIVTVVVGPITTKVQLPPNPRCAGEIAL